VKTILIRNHGRFGCVVHSEKPIVGYPARAHLENQTLETMKNYEIVQRPRTGENQNR